MKRDTIFIESCSNHPRYFSTFSRHHRPTPKAIGLNRSNFRIDGVLIPPDDNGLVLFSEVQMQPNSKLYERIFSEVGLYTYGHTESFEDWQAVAIYPTQKIEQPRTKVPRELFDSGRIIPIYLDELGAIESLPLNIGLLVLTILEGEEAIVQAKAMMERARRLETGNGIMEMVSTIIGYKFTTFTRDEVNAMLGYTTDELKQTCYYKDIRDEEHQTLVLMQLDRKLGKLSLTNKAKIKALAYDRLQDLTLALLDFQTSKDLTAWLKANN